MRLVYACLARALIVISFLGLEICAQTPTQTGLAEFEELASTLVSLKSLQEREQLLSNKKELMTPDLRKALIRQGNAQLLAGRYSSAFEIYGLAQNISEQIGDREGVATAWLDIGTVYYFQANYPAALEHYKKARELFTEVTNHYESAKALSGLALIYKEQRREKEALEAFQQVLHEFTSLGDTEEAANALNSIGAIYYGKGEYTAAAEAFLKSSETNSNVDSVIRLADALYMQGDYTQAFSYYKQSLERVSKGGIGALVSAVNGAANSAYYLGNYEEALQYYQRSVTIHKTQTEKLGLANALKGLANVHRSQGDYGAALESYFKSLAVSEEIKAPLGTTLGSIGLVRALQGDFPRALDYYGKALKEFAASSNKIEMARVLSLIGNVQYRQGNFDLSLVSYRQALSLREEMEDKSGQGDILAGIGSTLLRQKNYSEALDSFHKALELFDSVRNQERMAEVLTRISEAFLLQNDFTKALSAAENAVAISTQRENRDALWYAQTLAGKAHSKLDHSHQAYQAFTTAISIVESLRSQPSVVVGRDHNSSLPYLSAIDFLISQHRPSEAFHYAERAKTQMLIDLLKSGNAVPQKGLSADKRLEEQRLAGQIVSFEIQLEREGEQRNSSEKRKSDLQTQLRRAREDFAGFRQRIFNTNPQVKVHRGELAPLKLDEIRSLITDTSTALLEYTITENNTYLFALTADMVPAKTKQRRRTAEINLKVYPLEIRHDALASRVRNLEQLIASRSDNFHEAARELYDLLIKPAEGQIALKTKLVIVPDGALWRLPFEALQPVESHYVVDHMQVSYAPSLSALREMRNLRRSTRRRNSLLFAYGNPALSNDFITRLEFAHAGTKLESSAEQEEEIKNSVTSYGTTASRFFAGAEASEERVKSDVSGAKILHFSSPAILDDTSPMSSFIGLSTATGQQDGFLQSREILNLQSSADLIVLTGARQKGDLNGASPVGFSWSWFVAGTPTTMLSRWTVDLPARSALLNKFYSYIKPASRASVPKGRALHQSLLLLRRSSAFEHPYYWANFTMIGDAH